jgi:YHS domain-containing protein
MRRDGPDHRAFTRRGAQQWTVSRLHQEGVMAKDPVCRMNVDEKEAITSTHGGKTYYFCSANCQSAFDKDSGKYAKS